MRHLSAAAAKRALSLLDRHLGVHEANGAEADYPCPYCEQRGANGQGHLHVNVAKNVYLCHHCGASGGNIRNVLRDVLGFAPEDLDDSIEVPDLPIPKLVRLVMEQLKKDQPLETRVKLPDEFIRLTFPPIGLSARIFARYVKRRGITSELADDVGVGYCVEGRYTGYLILPVWVSGVLRYFTSRRVWGGGPKNLNPKVQRRNVLFNYDLARREDHVVIVEGPFDALSFGHRGISLLGHTITDDQVRLLDAMQATEITVMMDADAHEATRKIAATLRQKLARKITYVLMKEGDPNDHRDELEAILASRKRLTAEKAMRWQFEEAVGR